MNKRKNDFLESLQGMHLQWFAEAVEIEEEEDDSLEDDSVEFLVEGRDEIPPIEEEESGPSREELLRELTDLKERQSLVSSQLGDRKSLEEGFSKLSEALERQRESGNLKNEEALPSWEETKKRLAKNFYDDPMTAVEETLRYFVKSEIAPAFQQTQDMLSKTAVSTSKQLASSNDMNKMIMDRFHDEVEAAVKRLPQSPDVYEKACQQVGMNHFTDIVAFQVEESLKGTSGNATPTTKRPTSNVNPSSIGNVGKSTHKERRILTRDQKDWADKKGVSYEDAWAVFNTK